MFDQDGADIVFVAGAPGSKWSAIAHAVMYADDINISDLDLNRSYHGPARTFHFGNYFGPGMEFGRTFDNLSSMSKDELLSEFAAPYQSPGGVKLLKSHIFSQKLPFLAKKFPKARFLLVQRSDKQCLEWWAKAGGFSITFPDYGWYNNYEKMLNQIERDNQAISSFAESYQSKLVRRRSLKPILNALGLKFSTANLKKLSETEFERKWGYGNQSVEAVEATCHSMARLASVCVISPANKFVKVPIP